MGIYSNGNRRRNECANSCLAYSVARVRSALYVQRLSLRGV